MILVMTGTNPYSFDRLVRPLDEMAGQFGWDDVFVQLGHTRYAPENCQAEPFVERARLLKMVEESELVVTQGGYGGIRDALFYNKPLVAVPRYPALGEATDCQEELVRAMESLGYLIGVYNIDNLGSAIEQARTFLPAPRMSSRIPELLNEYFASR